MGAGLRRYMCWFSNRTKGFHYTWRFRTGISSLLSPRGVFMILIKFMTTNCAALCSCRAASLPSTGWTSMSTQPPSVPQVAFHAPLPFNVLPKAPEGTLVCQSDGSSSLIMSASNRRHVRSRPGGISGAFVLKGSSPSLHCRLGCTGRTVLWQGRRSLRTGVGVPAAEFDSGLGEVAVRVDAVAAPGQALRLDAAAASPATTAAATATAAAVDDEAVSLLSLIHI